MPQFSRVKGATSQKIFLLALDTTSTTGGEKTGLAYNTSGISAYYCRAGAAPVSITLATQTPTGAFSSGGFVEIDATNLKGVYRLDVPDAAFASGADLLCIQLKGTGFVSTPQIFSLTGWDELDGVRGGMTALPNAAAGASSGLPLSVDSSGRVDVLKINGTSQTARDLGASVLISSGTGTGQLDVTSGVIKANLAQILSTALTETSGLLAGGFKKFFNVASPVLTAASVNQTGDAFGLIGTAGAGLTALGDTRLANLDATISSRSTFAGGAVASVTGAVGSVTGNVGGNVVGSVASVTAGVTVTTNNDKTGYGLSSTAIQAIWDAATSALSTVGSIGKWILDKLDVVVSTRSTYAGGDTSGVTTLLSRIPGTVAAQTGDSYARLGANGAGLTAIGDTRIANLDATISSRSTFAGGAVASVTAPVAITAVFKKNTAIAAYVFHMVQTDGVTPLTGVSITAERRLDGGSYSSCANSVVELDGGDYKIALAATDTNCDVGTFRFSGTGGRTLVQVFVFQP